MISLFLIAILGCVKSTGHGIPYTQAALAVSWLAIYSMTVGPIVYTLVAEIGATRLRTQTVVLGRSSYYVANIIGGVLEPYMINPTECEYFILRHRVEDNIWTTLTTGQQGT